MLPRDYGKELHQEITKWGNRLGDALASARVRQGDGEGFLRNIRAYQSDAERFLEEGDLVRSFESLVWAWAWLEIGNERGLLSVPALEEPRK